MSKDIWGDYRPQASTEAYLEESRLRKRQEADEFNLACSAQPTAAKVSDPVNKRKHSHYFKDVANLQEIDIYRVCMLFGVDDPSGATQHALKKILLPGQRGAGKDRAKDLQEAVDTLTRKLEMLQEDAA